MSDERCGGASVLVAQGFWLVFGWFIPGWFSIIFMKYFVRKLGFVQPKDCQLYCHKLH